VRYRVERALALLAPPLARALASLVPEAALAPAQLAPQARAVVRGAASQGDPDDARLLEGLAEAALGTLVEQLFALSVAPPAGPLAAGLLRELRAFESALQ
jgi:hypothetical protein